MARIYIARTTGIGSFERHVVLKLITPERANDTIAVQMFLDEARLAASLNHQNVAQVFEVGEDGGIHYLAMEYVHGQDLRALLAKAGSQGTRVPLELALTVVAGAAAGLNHAHERRDGNGVPLGIVHRDVSPSNIMIGLDGAVKLLDFGIAKATQRSVETQSGIIKGKFAYMSPEQCRGRDVDRRSDVFSLGIILYEITTQHRCFRADSDFDTMHRIVTGDVVRPTRLIQGYPQALEAVVMKALAVDANQRYQSAGQLLEALEAFAMSSRMSLSMMALGRFMRELFGETPEPWLAAGARNANPTVPKESTISNTNGSNEIIVNAPAPANEPPHHQVAARTLLDLDLPPESRNTDFDPDDNSAVAEWNAKSYPTMQPTYASMATLPPGELKAVKPGRSSNPNLPALVPAPSGTTPPPVATPALPATLAAVLPPVAAFTAHPGSGSGPAHQSVGSGTGQAYQAKPGFANASVNDISYPRYEPPVEEESAADVRLQPNRRPLVIGIGILVVGVVILLFVGLGGKKVETPSTTTSDPPTPPATNNQVTPSQPEQAKPEPPEQAKPVQADVKPDEKKVVPPPEPDPVEEIGVKIVSEPDQANVLLAGKPLGQTPLDIKLPRGTGLAMITIQKAGYEEVTTNIDLAGDSFSKDVTLVKVAPKPDVKKPDVKKPDMKKPDAKKPDIVKRPDPKRPDVKKPDKKPDVTPVIKKPDVKQPDKKPDPKQSPCQPPNQMDPFTDPRPPCPK